MPRHRAFTLAELLVVIGIIVLLLALLFPSLNRARESAHSIHCQANVRSVVGAMRMYALDNDGMLPTSSDLGTVWTPKSPGYISYFYPSGGTTSIEFQHGAFMRYISSDSEVRKRTMRCVDAEANSANYNYVLNGQIGYTTDAKTFHRLPQVHDPASKILLVEMNGVGPGFDGHFNIDESAQSGNQGNTDEPANLHLRNGKIGYGSHGFADGHVESLTRGVVDAHREWFNLDK